MLHAVDYGIVALYLVATIAIGYWSSRRGKAETSAKDFFVAEKTLPWWVVGLTMIAASISAEQMLGEVGTAKDNGLVTSNWELGVYPSVVLMVLLFLPLYLRSGITTIPEYLEKRFGRSTSLIFAGYTVFNNACVALVMVLALGGAAIHKFVPGIAPIHGVIALALFTGLYTIYGGMSSVAWTDAFQCVLLLAGGLVVFVAGLSHVDGGWSGLMSRMGERHQDHLVRGLDDGLMPWPGLILLVFSTNVWYGCTSQFYVQSCLGAKNAWHGKMGVLLTGLLWPVLTLCTCFPGYMAADLIRTGRMADIQDANGAYPLLIAQFLGTGLRGFLAAAILAAIMSTVSSLVNANASVFAVDIYRRWLRPDADDRSLVRVGRWAGVATLLVGVPLTLVAQERDYIFLYSQNAWCFLAIPIMIVFTFGALWRRATKAAANATFLFIVPFVAIPFVLGNESWMFKETPYRMHLFTFACLLWVVAAVFFVAVSLLTRAPDPAAVEPLVWKRGLTDPSEASLPWYKSIVFWSVAMAVAYVIIYIVYW